MSKPPVSKKNTISFISKNETVWVRVKFDRPIYREHIDQFVIIDENGLPDDHEYTGTGYMAVVLNEDLQLILLDGKPSRIAKCSCSIPFFDNQQFSNLNSAQKRILNVFSPDTHNTRSVYENCFVKSGNSFRALHEIRSEVDPTSDEVKNIRKLLANLGQQGQLAVIKQLMGLVYKNSEEDNSVIPELVAFISERKDLVLEIIKSNITKDDLTMVSYRKDQLFIFEKLISDNEFFKHFQQSNNIGKQEAVWQYFFQKNTWIFGYGLRYIFMSPLDDGKLEKVTTGYSISEHGKRIDALLKTRGVISSMCFVELKTHKTPLLAQLSHSYRPDSWSVSSELAGGVAQVQKTVQKAIKSISSKYSGTDDSGDPTGEFAYLYQPRSILVIGSLSEFNTSHGVNEEKYSSFELFRQHIMNPEIITFDELFERAKFIVSTLLE